MEWLVHAMLSNALAVTVLAMLVAILGRACRRPALIHGLWLVVMLKLVTPPVVPVSLPVAVNLVPARWSQVEPAENRLVARSTLTEPRQDLAEATDDEKVHVPIDRLKKARTCRRRSRRRWPDGAW